MACASLTLTAVRASGQGQTAVVSGVVTSADHQPLMGVLVSLTGSSLSIATSATGRYTLPRVPLGPQVFEFRRIGYAPREVAIEVSSSTFTVNAVLQAQPIELGTVVVEAASRAPDRMIDAPAAITVVQPTTGEPASVTGQIPVALARVPGLDVVQNGINDFNVNARGFNKPLNRNVLVLQDGRDVATLGVIRQFWSALSEPLEDLGRIEVMRGPGSALYGPNAFNGVINIVTPAARDIVGTKLTLGGGELRTARVDLRQAGVLYHGRLGYRINVGYSRSDDWSRSRTACSDWKQEYAPATDIPPTCPGTAGPDSIPLNGQTRDSLTHAALGTAEPLSSAQGSARADYYAANGSIVTLEGGTAQSNNQVNIINNGRNQNYAVARPWARLAWDRQGNGLSAWYTGLSYPQGAVRLNSGTPQQNSEAALHLEGRASRTFDGGVGRVVVGASVQNNAVNTQGTILSAAYDDRNDQYYGAFGQLEYRIGRVRLIGAARWDNSNLYTAQVSPKGALVYSMSKNHAVRFTVGRGFLTPSLNNLFAASPAGPGVQNLTAIEAKLRADPSVGPALAAVPIGTLFTNSAAVAETSLGNTGLRPQTMMSYEVGYKGQFGWRAFVSLDAYVAHNSDFTTPLLPAGTTGINSNYQPWTAPLEVPANRREEVEDAAYAALAAKGPLVQAGLTRLPNDTTAIVLSFGNAGVVDEWGIELGSSVALTRTLSLGVSYTWYDFAVQNNIVGNVLSANTPHHKGSVSLDYADRHGLTFGVDARIVESYHWTSGVYDGNIPASQIVNLQAGYRITPRLRVYAYGTNILDQPHFEIYGGSVNGRRVLAGMTTTF